MTVFVVMRQNLEDYNGLLERIYKTEEEAVEYITHPPDGITVAGPAVYGVWRWGYGTKHIMQYNELWIEEWDLLGK